MSRNWSAPNWNRLGSGATKSAGAWISTDGAGAAAGSASVVLAFVEITEERRPGSEEKEKKCLKGKEVSRSFVRRHLKYSCLPWSTSVVFGASSLRALQQAPQDSPQPQLAL